MVTPACRVMYSTQAPSDTFCKIPNIRAGIAATRPNRWTTARKRQRSSTKVNGYPIPTRIFRPSCRKKYGIKPMPFLSRGAPAQKPMAWGIRAGIPTAARSSAESMEHPFTGNPSKRRREKRSFGNVRCTVNTEKRAATCLPFAPRNWILFWQSSFRSW